VKTSLYRFYATDDTLLYVGQSRNPFQRLSGHFCDKDMPQVRHIELEWFDCPADALRAEAWAIRREKPLWNVMSPEKPRKVRVTPQSARPRQVDAIQASRFYRNIGPHLPPTQGPPKPLRQFAVGLTQADLPDIALDFSFCVDDISRAIKVGRAGDVIHLHPSIKLPGRFFLSDAPEKPYVLQH